MSDPTPATTPATFDAFAATNALSSRISSLESNVSSLIASFNKIVAQDLPPIRDKLIALEAAIGSGVETVATDALAFVKEQIAAIEAHLVKTPQAGGVTFKPASVSPSEQPRT